jgi:two-component system, OmpR family, alkaline phosphatase synthesis response regulator PhoP
MSDEKQVLIIDDEPDAIDITEAMLSTIEGITTISSQDGINGLAKARESLPDMVILDVQMPGKNGFEVFADLKKDSATKDIPVIMLTGVEVQAGIGFSADNMFEFLGEEPDAYIEKPVDAEMLLKTVSRLLGK